MNPCGELIRSECSRSILPSTIILVGALLVIGSADVASQENSDTSAVFSHRRRATITAGLGNTFGWLGAAGEYYLMDGHASAVIGLGYWPFEDYRGIAYAAALRRYIGGRKHRLFVEGSWSGVYKSERYDPSAGTIRTDTHYGPGASVGYQYTAGSGFTFIVGGGAGWEPEFRDISTIITLGVGYTWKT